ncbi:hypothetical protein ACFE04_006604 [Oxalis oulophora]
MARIVNVWLASDCDSNTCMNGEGMQRSFGGFMGEYLRDRSSFRCTDLLVCLATFLKVSEGDSFDPYQELLKALIGFIDVAGLYFALTQLTHRNISQNHKFQAVGLGWAFADSVLHRLAPLWVGARGLEFTWDFILQGLEANANLVLSVSLAGLGSLMWLRKNKPKTLIPIIYLCAGIVATMPSITRFLPEARTGMAFPKGGGL